LRFKPCGVLSGLVFSEKVTAGRKEQSFKIATVLMFHENCNKSEKTTWKFVC